MKPLILALVVFFSYGGEVVNSSPAPDLSTMLKTLGGDTGISKLMGIVHEYKMARDIFKEATDANPILLQILTTFAKKNPKMEVVLKVMAGKMPNIHDLYGLATTKSKNIYTNAYAIFAENPSLQQYWNLITSPTTLSNQRSMEQLIEVMSGKKIKLNNESSLIQRMQSNNFKIAPGDDLNVVNAMEFMNFVIKNIHGMGTMVTRMMKGDSYFNILSALLNLDFSNMQKVVEQPRLLKGGKYQVGLRNLKQDPDVVQLMHDVTAGLALKSDDPHVNDKAEALIYSMTKKYFSIEAKLMQGIGGIQPTKSNMIG